MPESVPIIHTILTSFWGVVAVLGVFFGITDLFKHLGNRLDKRRAMEIYRELMKDRIELLNNAVQFGADEKSLAELGRIIEKHADLHQLTELTELRVVEDGDGKPKVNVTTITTGELPDQDLSGSASRSSGNRQTEGGQQ